MGRKLNIGVGLLAVVGIAAGLPSWRTAVVAGVVVPGVVWLLVTVIGRVLRGPQDADDGLPDPPE